MATLRWVLIALCLTLPNVSSSNIFENEVIAEIADDVDYMNDDNFMESGARDVPNRDLLTHYQKRADDKSVDLTNNIEDANDYIEAVVRSIPHRDLKTHPQKKRTAVEEFLGRAITNDEEVKPRRRGGKKRLAAGEFNLNVSNVFSTFSFWQ